MSEFAPDPEGLARQEEVGIILGMVCTMASSENNVYVTSDLLALQDRILDRFNLIGEDYGISDTTD